MGKQAFHGTLEGNGPEVSRLGSKNNGIVAMVHGWDGGVRVYMWRPKDDPETDWVRIMCGPHGVENMKVLYEGPVGVLHRDMPGLIIQAAQRALENEHGNA